MSISPGGKNSGLGFYNDARLLLLSPLTPLHVGAGSSFSTVDLPIQRDPLGYPVIYASSLKGVFKTSIWRKSPEQAKKLFGPEPDDEEKYTAPLAVIDANLLLIPARSTEGMVMVTSPHLLARALDMVDLLLTATNTVGGLKDTLTKLLKNLDLNVDEAYLYDKDVGDVLIAGIKLKIKRLSDDEKSSIKSLAGELKNALPGAYQGFMPGKISIVDDTIMLRIISRSLIVQTRIRIDRRTKTVSERGLWTEEHLPPGTLLVSGILLSDLLLKKDISHTDIFANLNLGYLVLGGKETTGRGIVKVTLL